MENENMFSFTNVTDRCMPLSITVKYKGNVVNFDVSSVLNKRNKDELNTLAFYLLNSYVNYKGDDFKKRLFDAYVKAESNVFLCINQPLDIMPTHIISDVLKLFDLNDIIYYLNNVYKLTPPENLATEFDQQIEADGRGSRDQTYIKSDYIELVALTLIIKAIAGPLCYFASIKIKNFQEYHKEYYLLNIIRKFDIYYSAPMQKLHSLIKKLIEVPIHNSTTEDSIRIIEKRIPAEEISVYILAIIVIQKLITADIVNDTKDKNIITYIYNYANNKLRPSGDVSKSIRSKAQLGADDGETESIIESHRVIVDLPEGEIVTINWAVSSVDIILKQLKFSTDINNPKSLYIDKNLIDIAYPITRQMLTLDIDKTQIQLLSIIFKDIIDPRSIDHIKIEELMNLFIVGFAYLWTINYKVLAILLLSVVDNSVPEDEITFSSTVNKSRLPKELVDELNYYFPLTKPINNDTNTNIVIDIITKLSNELYAKKWIPLVPTNLLKEAIEDPYRLIPADIKIILCNFILDHEKRRY